MKDTKDDQPVEPDSIKLDDITALQNGIGKGLKRLAKHLFHRFTYILISRKTHRQVSHTQKKTICRTS